MAFIVHVTISDEVYNGTKKLMNSEDQDIDKVFMRALTLYKFAKDVEAAGGEINFKIKGQKRRRIKVP
jgi:hypothetical protein